MFIKVAGEKKEYSEGLTVKELIEKEGYYKKLHDMQQV